MDGEKLIQVSFQIPPSALDSLSRLAEQLRMLTETAAAQTAPGARTVEEDRGKSGSFDPERFWALREGADLQPQAVRAEISDVETAKTASAEISQSGDAEMVSASISQAGDAETVSASISQAGDAETASSDVLQAGNADPVSAGGRKGPQDAISAGETLRHFLESPAGADAANAPQNSPPEERDVPLPPAEAARTSPFDEIPAVRAAADAATANAPEAVRAVERQIPDARSAEYGAEEREPAPDSVRGEVSGSAEMPPGAGMVVQTRLETPLGRWGGAAEELVIPGPAPLTAEAVSLAFERDGRRYDNGFPLY